AVSGSAVSGTPVYQRTDEGLYPGHCLHRRRYADDTDPGPDAQASDGPFRGISSGTGAGIYRGGWKTGYDYQGDPGGSAGISGKQDLHQSPDHESGNPGYHRTPPYCGGDRREIPYGAGAGI